MRVRHALRLVVAGFLGLAATASIAMAQGGVETNTDRPGNDLGPPIELEFRQNSFLTFEAECQGLCAGNRRCVAWTMVKPGVQGPKARCYLKNRVPAPRRNNCCSSGVKAASSGGGGTGGGGGTPINVVLDNFFANATSPGACNAAFGQCHTFGIAHFGVTNIGLAAAECQRRLQSCLQRVAGSQGGGTTGGGGGGGVPGEWAETLRLHNARRAQHRSPPLTWSASLAAQAQAWANRCSFSHADFNGFGENLYWGSNANGSAATEWWYNEVRFYDWNNPIASYNAGDSDRSREVRHFTQVVWRATTTLGCGIAQCGNRKYVVCRYTPPGNFNANNPGVLQQNVQRN
ncbi:MAG: hypothetical protein GC150_12890 [Rhizobiales bacterium]|nr:hypothetical protein [Hyphomicrobiales bacterium]